MESNMDNLLHDPSTMHVFCSSKCLENIHHVNGQMKINTNRGVSISEQQGHCQSLGKVWCHQNATMNSSSFNEVKNLFRITLDSDMEDANFSAFAKWHTSDV